MIKKISEMTTEDKAEYLESTKRLLMEEHGVPWEFMKKKIMEEINNTFDDAKFVKMSPDARIDAVFARKEFGDKKPDLIDYMLWSVKFVTHSEYVEW